jgi:hypothetical protein
MNMNLFEGDKLDLLCSKKLRMRQRDGDKVSRIRSRRCWKFDGNEPVE